MSPYGKYQNARDNLFVKATLLILVDIPLGLSKAIFQLLSKVENPWVRRGVLLAIFAFALSFLLGFEWILRGFSFLYQARLERALPLGLKLALFYLAYLFATLPIFLLFTRFSEESRLLAQESRTREPDPQRMRYHRLRSSYGKVYLGESYQWGKPIYLTNEQRIQHCETIGSTGTGKTESVLLPILAHDIRAGKGAIILDGKGDLELFNRILWIVKASKRPQDFFYFSLTHPKKSNTYNPLCSFKSVEKANPTELKDKLVNSMVWSEEFYRRMAEQAALTLFNAIGAKGRRATFRELHSYLTDRASLNKLHDQTRDLVLKNDLAKMIADFEDHNHKKFLSGLIADIFINARSEFSDLLDTTAPEIDLLDLYEKNRICYFSLDLQKYVDTSRRLGRMIIQDIRACSSHIQSTVPSGKRKFFPIFIDDASSFLDVNFIEFLNKCRASGFAVMILHQSPGDLVFRNAPSFQQQFIENTNIKIILRQDDPYSVEKFAKIGGTRKTTISTYQTEEKILGKGFTGVGSIREGQTFRIEPDLIRGLKRGEAALIWKSPSFHADFIKLDFFGYPTDAGHFEQNRASSQGEKKEDIFSEGKMLREREETLSRIKGLAATRKKETPI